MNQRIKFSRSEKVYMPGTLFPEIRVAMRKVEQVPSTTFENGEKVITPNPDVYIYDTSGPFSDPNIEVHQLTPLLLLTEFEKMHFQTEPYPQILY